jgi:HlyD family type I secretion membrane fusion protein
VDLNYLLEKQLVQKSRVLALEREKSRLEGIIGRSTADMAKAENSIGEARLQIQQLRQKFLEEVTGQISEIRQKLSDQRERLNVARDVFSRLTIRSPKGGTVQNLKVFTVGQVIKSGEPLLDVVPEDDRLILSVQASPVDGERIRVGMETEVRFPSFNMRRMPLIFGRVRSVSRDRLMDEATRQPYFLVLVEVDESTLPSEIKGRLIAGLPAEIYVPTGERAVLDYLLAPIQERVGKAFREQ